MLALAPATARARRGNVRAAETAPLAPRPASTTATRRATPAARRDRVSRAICVSATATVPSFGSGNGPSNRPTPSGMRPAMLPTSTPARHAVNPPRALSSARQRADQARPAGPAREPRRACDCPRSGEPRHTTRPSAPARRRSSIARISTPPKLWPTRCTVSPGDAVDERRERRRVRRRAIRVTDG